MASKYHWKPSTALPAHVNTATFNNLRLLFSRIYFTALLCLAKSKSSTKLSRKGVEPRLKALANRDGYGLHREA